MYLTYVVTLKRHAKGVDTFNKLVGLKLYLHLLFTVQSLMLTTNLLYGYFIWKHKAPQVSPPHNPIV